MNYFWGVLTTLITTLTGIFVGHSLSNKRIKESSVITLKNKFEANVIFYIEYQRLYLLSFKNRFGNEIWASLSKEVDLKALEEIVYEKRSSIDYEKNIILAKKDITECITGLGNMYSKSTESVVIKLIEIDSIFTNKFVTTIKKKIEGLGLGIPNKEKIEAILNEIIDGLFDDYYNYFNDIKKEMKDIGIYK